MSAPFRPRCPPPSGLVVPVAPAPKGEGGPTAAQVRGPSWRRTSPGLYVPAAIVPETEQRILEQAQRLPSKGAVGGWAALRMHGAAYFEGREDKGQEQPVPLWVPPGQRLRPLPGSTVVRTELRPDSVQMRHGVRCVSAEAALVHVVARAPGLREAVVMVDMALAAGIVAREQIATEVARSAGRRGISQVRRAMLWADARSLSPAETWMRLVWMFDAGLPRPLINWPVADSDGRRLGRPDLLCPELAVAGEYDGADHRSRRRHGIDVEREDLFRGVGLEVFTVVASNQADVPKVVARMLAAVARAAAARRPRTWMVATNPPPV